MQPGWLNAEASVQAGGGAGTNRAVIGTLGDYLLQESEDPTVLLRSMSRFFKLLPGDQRQAFLHEVTEKAS